MFFVGSSSWGDDSSYANAYVPIDAFHRLELTNMILDEIMIETTTDEPYTTQKKPWSYLTYLLAKFKNNLEAGTIDLGGADVDNIKLQRRREGEIIWQDLITWEYNVDKRIYSYLDRYVANCDIYEYRFIPVATDGTLGKANSDSIEVSFSDYFIIDQVYTYKLIMDARYGSFEYRKPYSIFTPFGSQYPIVVTSGNLNYTEGSFSGKIFLELDDMCLIDTHYTDYICMAKTYRRHLVAFLNNGHPKILKDFSGEMFLVYIYDVKLDFEEKTFNVIGNISFNFVEIGDKYNLDDLRDNNLLPSEVLKT